MQVQIVFVEEAIPPSGTGSFSEVPAGMLCVLAALPLHTVFRSSELFCVVNAQSARSLIDKFLTLDPNKRISAKDALDSDYFWEDPLPCKPSELPKYEPSHEFQTRKRRQVRESSTPAHFSRVLSRVLLLFARVFHVQVLI